MRTKPGLAAATDKAWKDKVAMHMQSVKANGPKTKRAGLAALAEEEARYEFMSMTTEQALAKLEAMKSQLPAWAWKWIVMLTSLRVNHVTAADWETFTPEEDKVRFADMALYPIFSKWASDNTGMWRPEHGRTHEVIVTRAVCNETAEHAQHIRGHLPPGGLTDNAARYVKLAAEKTPGSYFIHPTAAEHYTQGASIFWLRFVNYRAESMAGSQTHRGLKWRGPGACRIYRENVPARPKLERTRSQLLFHGNTKAEASPARVPASMPRKSESHKPNGCAGSMKRL